MKPRRTSLRAKPGSNGSGRLAAFPIVGIGASAGGLEACSQMLQNLPDDTGMGFVLVQHLDPEHESALPKLLGRATSMPVVEVKDRMTVEPNRVHVIPPNVRMSISGGMLQLSPRTRVPGTVRTIDFFLQSLAEDLHELAIGVILSGSATDGTLGLEAIKAENGIAFAQDDSAKFDSMPRSAVAAGCVDFVLSPAGIAAELTKISRHPLVRPGSESVRGPETAPDDAPLQRESAEPPVEDTILKILLLIRTRVGTDFSGYKMGTIRRRIARRMVITKKETTDGYLSYLRATPLELEELYGDLLISVTGFFRDSEVYEHLKQKVFPKLLRNRPPRDPLRIWSVGCSTGQEPYSLAMALLETSGKNQEPVTIQIFATDLSEKLLERARSGFYSEAAVQDVRPDRLKRFFVREPSGGYRIAKSIRELCVFAPHDILSDPPFSKIDLVCFRNVMIYLGAALQKQVLPVLHYALKPHGLLLLGTSETVTGSDELFEMVDKKHKVFIKKSTHLGLAKIPLIRKSGVAHPVPRHPAAPRMPEPQDAGVDIAREADRLTLAHYSPAGVLVNGALEIVQFRGDTSAYLTPPRGRATLELLKMAREGLMLPLRSAIRKARTTKNRVRKEQVSVHQNGDVLKTTIEVIPLRDRHLLILFHGDEGLPGAERTATASSRQRPSAESRREASGLKQDLAEARDYVRSLQEQYETANEELQAANEESKSTNEELQSVNEELETSKEELESMNEELITVNDEMVNRNAQLSLAYNDLNSLIGTVDIPIILLALDRTLRHYTPPAEKLFRLLPTDIGRPLHEISHNLRIDNLDEILAGSLESGTGADREVQDKDDRWYELRIRPNITREKELQGAVVIFLDITDRKRDELSRRRLAAIVEASEEAIVGLDANGVVTTWNGGAERLLGYTAEEIVGRHSAVLWNPDQASLLSAALAVVMTGQGGQSHETIYRRKDGTAVDVIMTASPIRAYDHSVTGISKILVDISRKKKEERELREAKERLAEQAANLDRQVRERTAMYMDSANLLATFIFSIAHDMREPLVAMRGYADILADKYSTALDSSGIVYANKVKEISVTLDRIVSDLLIYGAISQVSPDRLEPHDMKHAVETVLSQQYSHVRESKARVNTVYAPNPPAPVLAHWPTLQQVLSNLISNALKFVAVGVIPEIKLSIDEVREDGGEQFIRFAVEDNGIGITPQRLKHLFTVFEREHPGKYPGTGLGLAIIEKGVNRMGGKVGVESTVGRGSRFWIMLRSARQPAEGNGGGT